MLLLFSEHMSKMNLKCKWGVNPKTCNIFTRNTQDTNDKNKKRKDPSAEDRETLQKAHEDTFKVLSIMKQLKNSEMFKKDKNIQAVIEHSEVFLEQLRKDFKFSPKERTVTEALNGTGYGNRWVLASKDSKIDKAQFVQIENCLQDENAPPIAAKTLNWGQYNLKKKLLRCVHCFRAGRSSGKSKNWHTGKSFGKGSKFQNTLVPWHSDKCKNIPREQPEEAPLSSKKCDFKEQQKRA